MPCGNEIPFKDALVAIAGVSAVLWTGGLIVLQLRHDGVPRGNDEARLAHRFQTEAIKGAMACIAFGMLAPLFILFLADGAARTGAVLFSAFYLWYTWRAAWNILDAIRNRNWGIVPSNLGFFAPTVAMLIVVAFPTPLIVATLSAILVFWGYFLLSASVNALGRP